MTLFDMFICRCIIQATQEEEKNTQKRISFRFPAIILLTAALAACTSYERQVVPFKLPSAYPNAVEIADAVIAAKSFDNKDEAGNAFGTGKLYSLTLKF